MKLSQRNKLHNKWITFVIAQKLYWKMIKWNITTNLSGLRQLIYSTKYYL